MSKPTNFRREVKNLWKNYQRGDITWQGVGDWFEERGIISNPLWIQDILKNNIESRIFSRLGRGALKKGQFVLISDIVRVLECRKNKALLRAYKDDYSDFHKIPFYTQALEETISYKTILIKDA